jgi:hypothetical protein
MRTQSCCPESDKNCQRLQPLLSRTERENKISDRIKKQTIKQWKQRSALYRSQHNRTYELKLQNTAYINGTREATYEKQTHELK